MDDAVAQYDEASREYAAALEAETVARVRKLNARDRMFELAPEVIAAGYMVTLPL